ncbi:MAG: hypothetical protein HY661_19300 [Betaproteobacteria bacterium]|nr:hypothetical protein [Betaproteobacteria bacterium]
MPKGFVAGLASGLAGGFQIGQQMDLRDKVEKRAQEAEKRAQTADRRSQEQHELLQRLRTLGVKSAEREAADVEAYRGAASGAPGESEPAPAASPAPSPAMPTASMGVRDASEVGDQQTATGSDAVAAVGNENDAGTGTAATREAASGTRAPATASAPLVPGGKTYHGMLGAVMKSAQGRGDIDTVQRIHATMSKLEDEGLLKVTKAALMGEPASQIEKIFNESGSRRIRAGSLSIGKDGKIAATTEDGTPYVFDVPRYAEITGLVKEKKGYVLNPGGKLVQDGKVIADNLRGLEQKIYADIAKIDFSERLKAKLRSSAEKNGKDSTTALIKNMDYLVTKGVAKTHDEAYQKLHNTGQKSEEDAAIGLARDLVRGGGYRGKDGATRAVREAQEIIQSLRQGKGGAGGEAAPGRTSAGSVSAPGRGTYSLKGKTFTDADIQATASKYGITPDAVRRQLGIR